MKDLSDLAVDDDVRLSSSDVIARRSRYSTRQLGKYELFRIATNESIRTMTDDQLCAHNNLDNSEDLTCTARLPFQALIVIDMLTAADDFYLHSL
jgi:hypothetical protein